MIIHLFLKSKNPMAMVLYQYGVPTFLQQRNYNFSGEGVTQKVMYRVRGIGESVADRYHLYSRKEGVG